MIIDEYWISRMISKLVNILLYYADITVKQPTYFFMLQELVLLRHQQEYRTKNFIHILHDNFGHGFSLELRVG